MLNWATIQDPRIAIEEQFNFFPFCVWTSSSTVGLFGLRIRWSLNGCDMLAQCLLFSRVVTIVLYFR